MVVFCPKGAKIRIILCREEGRSFSQCRAHTSLNHGNGGTPQLTVHKAGAEADRFRLGEV